MSDGDPVVVAAIAAGWAMAEFYDDAPALTQIHRTPSQRHADAARDASLKKKPSPIRHLAGASELDPRDLATAHITRVQLMLTAVSQSAPGVDPPDLSAIRTIAQSERPSGDAVREEIESLHAKIQAYLAGTHPAAATAYGLGRMLADTVLLPSMSEAGRAQFSVMLDVHRLSNAQDWLRDLESSLPPNSAGAVQYTLDVWQQWMAKQVPADGSKLETATTSLLRSQGRLWHQLLIGGTKASSLLEPISYIDAAHRTFDHLKTIALTYFRAWRTPIIITVIAIAALITGSLLVPNTASKIVLAIGTVLGALGVTWKGVGTTLGATLRKAQNELWSTEMTTAQNQAALIPPPAAKPGDTKTADKKKAEKPVVTGTPVGS